MSDLHRYLVCFLQHEGGEVALFDALNLTRQARRTFEEEILYSLGALAPRVLWVESSLSSHDAATLRRTWEVSLFYKQHLQEAPEAVRLLQEALAAFQVEPLAKPELAGREAYLSLIRLRDFGRYMRIFNISPCPLLAKIPVILANIAHCDHDLLLVPSGLSLSAEQGRLGGDSELGAQGHVYAMKVQRLLESLIEEQQLAPPERVFTSKDKRARQTLAHLDSLKEAKAEELFALHGLDHGRFDGHLLAQVPEEAKPRRWHHKWPDGESWQDVVGRIDPLIFELERAEGAGLVLADPEVLKAIYAYFVGITPGDARGLSFEPQWVVKLHIHGYGCDEVVYNVADQEDSKSATAEEDPAPLDPADQQQLDLPALARASKSEGVAKILRQQRRLSPEFRSPFRKDSFTE